MTQSKLDEMLTDGWYERRFPSGKRNINRRAWITRGNAKKRIVQAVLRCALAKHRATGRAKHIASTGHL